MKIEHINHSTSLFDFIKDKPFEQVKEELEQEPLNIKVNDKGPLYIAKYSQIDSNFNYLIVRQCRGIILEKGTNKVVAFPFSKFGNHGEGYTDEIDWKSAVVSSKIDGSIIKVYWYDGEWRVATNGTIDANDAKAIDKATEKEYSFRQLFEEALWRSCCCMFESLTGEMDKDYTYMFELVHPVSKVVISYEPDLYLIGMRNIKTFEEVNVFDLTDPKVKSLLDLGIKSPKLHKLQTIDDIVKTAKELPDTEEGYVVMDKDFHRMKVKGPAYLALHKLAGGKNLSNLRLLELIVNGVDDDAVASFPEYKDRVDMLKIKLHDFIVKVGKDVERIFNVDYKHDDWQGHQIELTPAQSRKKFALAAQKTVLPQIMFQMFDGRVRQDDVRGYVMSMALKRLEEYIK